MKGSALASVKHERGFGVWISSDLNFNKHTNDQCAQALIKCLATCEIHAQTMNSIKTRRTIYLTLVQSHLDYETQVW